ncbi:MAG: HicB family toxin-antitoxin system [Rhodococcus sp.]|nr:HicB family toxin-antitoxin system [Rhodococcus sp. (in: high G+C Gram-positive bacteria)]
MTSSANPYTANVTREGRWWMISIPELDELTQARRIGEAELMAREVIALHTGLTIDEIAVTVNIDTIGNVAHVSDAIGKVKRQRLEATRLDAEAAKEAKRIARELSGSGVPVRDIGELLDVSFQRAHQMIQN